MYITTMVPISSAGTGRKDSARAASTHPQPPAQEEQPAPEAVPEQAVDAAVVRGDATGLIYIIQGCAKLRKDSGAVFLRRRRQLENYIDIHECNDDSTVTRHLYGI